nr:cathelicidin-5-like [Odocoileus virginianus texanus]
METQRASLSLGRWSLWLLLLGLVLPSASTQALSYREAVLHAVDQPTEKSSEANLYLLLEPSPPSLGHTDEDLDNPKRVSFKVKEAVCPRTSQQSPEHCDFKEKGVVKKYGVTVTMDH